MIRYFTVVLMVIFASACSSILSQEQSPSISGTQQTSLPMELLYTGDIGGLPLVRVSIRGQQSYWLLDTGSSRNVISVELVKKYSLPAVGKDSLRMIGGVQSSKVHLLPDLHLGDLKLHNQLASAMDLSIMQASARLGIAGILGMPALKQLAVTIDYPAKQVELSLSALSRNTEGMPISFIKDVPTVELSVNEVGGRYILDTGNAGAMVLLRLVSAKQPLQTLRIGDMGGDVATQLSRLAALKIEGITLRQVPLSIPQDRTGFEDFSGSLGNALFMEGRVSFDFPRQRFYFESTKAAVDLPGGFGFIVNNDSSIMAILDNSNAAQTGLKEGDLIVSVNGKSVSGKDRHSFWQQLRKNEIKLTVSRQGKLQSNNMSRTYFLPLLIE